MEAHQRTAKTTHIGIGLALIVSGSLVSACSGRPSPAAPTAVTTNAQATQSGGAQPQPSAPAATLDPHSAHVTAQGQSEEKGYLDGWFEGSDVHLYYTKSGTSARSRHRAAPPRIVRSVAMPRSIRGPDRFRRSTRLSPREFIPIRQHWRVQLEACA